MFCSSRSNPLTSPFTPEKLVYKAVFSFPKLFSNQPDIDATEGEVAESNSRVC